MVADSYGPPAESDQSRDPARRPLRIFISYRHDDSAGYVGRLYDSLSRPFGSQNVFMDVSTIDPGRDFTEAIHESIPSCSVLLAVISSSWLSATDGQGRRRLEDPGDWVALEIQTALEGGVYVVPVLLEGTRMPRESELPAVLRPLARRQALQMTNAGWLQDLQRLVSAIEKVGREPDAPGEDRKPPEVDFRYDAYVSYADDEQAETWVWDTLLPRLEQEGLRVAVSGDSQQPGVERIVAIEQGIVEAKRTVVVLSSAYTEDNAAQFENVLAQTLGVEEGSYRLLPVILPGVRDLRLPLRLRMLAKLDLAHPRRGERNLELLLAALKQPLLRRNA